MANPKSQPILIVDDDPDSRQALVTVLADQGYRVVSFESCEQALEYLHHSAPPALILLDLQMSGMEGWEFRHKQKQDPQLADIPVISISAVGKLVDVEIALRKPVTCEELLAGVARYVPKPRSPRAGRHRAPRTPM